MLLSLFGTEIVKEVASQLGFHYFLWYLDNAHRFITVFCFNKLLGYEIYLCDRLLRVELTKRSTFLRIASYPTMYNKVSYANDVLSCAHSLDRI